MISLGGEVRPPCVKGAVNCRFQAIDWGIVLSAYTLKPSAKAAMPAYKEPPVLPGGSFFMVYSLVGLHNQFA